jgi:hypothetical protein
MAPPTSTTMEAGNQQLYRFPVNVSLSRFLLTLGLSMLLAVQPPNPPPATLSIAHPFLALVGHSQ